MPGAPEQITPKGLRDYLEVMSKAVFQTGISWRVVDNKWAGIREAFKGFDPRAVASFGPRDIEKLMQDTRVIRNRRKLEAVVDNARTAIDLEAEHGSFRNYLRSHADYRSRVQDMKKRFRFLGETGCYMFLYIVGEPVPDYHEWRESQGR
jgi:DNA-3-methyladenine glycosylase I